MFLRPKKTDMITIDQALTGRSNEMPLADRHTVLGTPLRGPWPAGLEIAYFGMGCFWGAERMFWKVPGVYSTAVGYQGGFTENPTYEETCTGRTGHTEAVQVVYDPAKVSYEDLLKVFWENHDPTQGMRQGNDVGTQYRSAIFPQSPEQRETAERVIARVNASGKWKRPVTTSVEPAATWYSAEAYHQDYLRKHPGGYSCHFLRD